MVYNLLNLLNYLDRKSYSHHGYVQLEARILDLEKVDMQSDTLCLNECVWSVAVGVVLKNLQI